MSNITFQKATKKQSKLRLALEGAAGCGKTYSALLIAKGISNKIAVIDTEHGSASLYSGLFKFDVLELTPPYTPEAYIEAIQEAEKCGYEVLIIDSISHEWNGEGGCLDIVNSLGQNSYTAWGKVTPRHDRFINTILRSDMHIITTMRAKANYEVGKDENTGKMTIEKQGTAPIQREGVDFEMTTVLSLNQHHYACATKDRTSLFDGIDFLITEDTGKKIIQWLNDGEIDKEKEEMRKLYLRLQTIYTEIKSDLSIEDKKAYTKTQQAYLNNKMSIDSFKKAIAYYKNKYLKDNEIKFDKKVNKDTSKEEVAV